MAGWELNLVRGMGYVLGQHLAVAGFSGLQVGRVLPGGLTSIATVRFDIGRLAAKKALDARSGHRTNPVLDVGSS